MNVVGLWIVGVGCEVWIELWNFGVFGENECDDENLMIWCHELMFWFILKLPWSVLTVSEVCTMILGQLEWKLGFWVEFCVSSREEPKNLGSLLYQTRLASLSLPWQDVQDKTLSFWRSEQLESFSDIPKCSF